MDTLPVEQVPITEAEIPLTQEVSATVNPSQSSQIDNSAELPPWMKKMVKRQDFLNRKYEHAHALFATAYNEFLDAINEINFEHDTQFTFGQAVTEYQGRYAADALPEEDDED